ncbi:lysoplasmalogenase family protein [Variovorax sp. J2P1-59]|uniref:lysoplasmalogenase family protein n=1 Tax=Variovorax flavidus TaxID=3053501 RepID=UPI0025789323|nr:lysoplasmalogenase family protein [Variovorax sp. J2P1-59]MDM0077315.1 lysoplasmalogenase family protein [Variovorax sp. J2P1-59]
MRPGQIIVLATPVFFLMIGIEFLVGRLRARRGTGQDTYRLPDTLNSIGLGMLSQISAAITGLLRIGIYTAIWSAFALFRNDDFWMQWYGWVLALVFYDFCYYWLHRFGHESAVLWAAHVVHHQSQHYNLSTALRQTSSGALLGWIFYLPMALAGVPPLVFGAVALIDLLYQFWVHTEQVGKLGWFDRWFCSPSNHRVHHAVNDRYVDRNYGGVLIVWDRLFGTFKEEDEPCVYGTRSPLQSWDPVWANAEVYWSLARDTWRTRRWRDKLRIWFKPPGWRPADVAALDPKPPFDIAEVRRYEPPASRGVQVFAAIQFMALLGGATAFLWYSDTFPFTSSLVWLTALTAGLWATGAVLQGRLSWVEVLFIDAAALATASGALGITGLHLVFKPLALVILIAFASMRARALNMPSRFALLLVGGLVASLAGDVLLMWPQFFVPGLVCFLLAHLAYIALFASGVGLFPRRRALAATLAVGVLMYAFLLAGGLPPGLRAPVGIYVVVIACMAAQALGRATIVGNASARRVAAGACLFMLSDALLATNRFVWPLPVASLWVLASYYAAQWLIASNASTVNATRTSPALAAI